MKFTRQCFSSVANALSSGLSTMNWLQDAAYHWRCHIAAIGKAVTSEYSSIDISSARDIQIRVRPWTLSRKCRV